MKSLLRREKRIYSRPVPKRSCTNPPPQPPKPKGFGRFLIPTIVLGSIAGGTYWVQEKYNFLGYFLDGYVSRVPPEGIHTPKLEEPAETKETPSETPETRAPSEPQPINPTAEPDIKPTEPEFEMDTPLTRPQIVLQGTEEPAKEEETVPIQEPVLVQTKHFEEVVQPLQEKLDDLHSRVTTIPEHHDQAQQMDELQQKLRYLQANLEKVTIQLESLESTSIENRQQNQQIHSSHQQIKDQIVDLNKVTEERLEQLSKSLSVNDEISTQVMTKVAGELLADTIKQNIELQVAAQQALQGAEQRHKVQLQDREDECTAQLRDLQRHNDLELKKLYEGYLQHVEQLNAALRKEYEAQAKDLITERQKDVEALFSEKLEDASKAVGDDRKILDELLVQQKTMTEDIEQLNLDRSRTLNLLDLARALLILQTAHKNSPKPFGEQLDEIKGMTETDPLLTSLISKIPKEEATKGIKTMPQLTEDFVAISERAKQLSLKQVNESKGLVATVYEYAKSSPQAGLVSGNDLNAVLSRCHYHLDRSAVEAVVKELQALDPQAQALYDGWIKQARARSNFDQTLNTFSTHLLHEISSLRTE